MTKENAVITFNGVVDYQMWARGAGAKVDILHVTERDGQLVVTYRSDGVAEERKGDEGPADLGGE